MKDIDLDDVNVNPYEIWTIDENYDLDRYGTYGTAAIAWIEYERLKTAGFRQVTMMHVIARAEEDNGEDYT